MSDDGVRGAGRRGADLAGGVLELAEWIGHSAADLADVAVPAAAAELRRHRLIVQRDAGSIRHCPVDEHIWQPPQGEQEAPMAPHSNAVRLRMHVLLLQHPSEQFSGVQVVHAPVPPRPPSPPPAANPSHAGHARGPGDAGPSRGARGPGDARRPAVPVSRRRRRPG